jgi:hypothetical protein
MGHTETQPQKGTKSHEKEIKMEETKETERNRSMIGE